MSEHVSQDIAQFPSRSSFYSYSSTSRSTHSHDWPSSATLETSIFQITSTTNLSTRWLGSTLRVSRVDSAPSFPTIILPVPSKPQMQQRNPPHFLQVHTVRLAHAELADVRKVLVVSHRRRGKTMQAQGSYRMPERMSVAILVKISRDRCRLRRVLQLDLERCEELLASFVRGVSSLIMFRLPTAEGDRGVR